MTLPKLISTDAKFIELDRQYLLAIRQKQFWDEQRKKYLEEIEKLMGEYLVLELPGGVFFSKVSKFRPGYTVAQSNVSFLQRNGPIPADLKKGAEF